MTTTKNQINQFIMNNLNTNSQTTQFTERRIEIQNLINELKKESGSRELSIVITKLQEAKMWLGQHIGTIEGAKSLDISTK